MVEHQALRLGCEVVEIVLRRRNAFQQVRQQPQVECLGDNSTRTQWVTLLRDLRVDADRFEQTLHRGRSELAREQLDQIRFAHAHILLQSDGLSAFEIDLFLRREKR